MASRTLNKIKLIGNLTADPRFSQTKSGHPLCLFTVATNRSWLPKGTNQRREETEFHQIVAWDKLAEICQELLKKGSKVFIAGRLQYRERNENGKLDRRAEIVAKDIIFL